MSATSPADAWAVGDQCPTCGDPGTMTLHWNGTHWSMVSSPDPGPKGNVLNAVAAVSPSDAWAVGSYGSSVCLTAATVILHWNGTAWKTVKSPDSGACNRLLGINAISATSAWAVGESCTFAVNHCHTLIARWNGTHWSKVPSPDPGPITNGLSDVTAVSPTDVWVAGFFCAPKCGGHVRTLILHWNGTGWATVTSPDPGNINSLAAVGATASNNAWSVGLTCVTSVCGVNTNALILHWNGTAWTVSSG